MPQACVFRRKVAFGAAASAACARCRGGLRCGGGIAAVALAGLLSACVVVPHTREVYDVECQVLTRQVTLQAQVVLNLRSCGGDECKALLVAAGVVTAATAVVSGSIAVVGNVVYWFERQGRCVRGGFAASPA